MQAKIQKWGNSLAVRLPNKVLKAVNFKPGSSVEITTSNSCMVISLQEDPLDELLAKITDENLHHEAFPKDNIGSESW
jgi:antitoxin MazE